MQELADQGDEVLKYKIEILEDTDGCSVQYRCANSLFLIHKLAAELDILFDRGIDAKGHGKKLIDALSGTDKTYLTAEFCSNVVFQPEAQDLTARKHSVLFCQMEDGKRKDLANFVMKFCHVPRGRVVWRKLNPTSGVSSKHRNPSRQSPRELMLSARRELRSGVVSGCVLLGSRPARATA